MTGPSRRRLDVELLRRRLVRSRAEAERFINAGRVLVDGTVADKSARMVAADQPVLITKQPDRFVSRGGDKLHHALHRFAVAVDGQSCVDIGASTGGFTDCLLQHGARQVVAVDSGHGQLHDKIRHDQRVEVLERTNARHLLDLRSDLRGSAGVVVADVSFISLSVLMTTLVGCAEGGRGTLVLLVKPQFEVGRITVSRGRGVIRDPQARLAALCSVADAATRAGGRVLAATASPLLGPAGNAEFFLHVGAPTGEMATGTPAMPLASSDVVDGNRSSSSDLGLDAMLAAAVAEAPDVASPTSPTSTVGPPACPDDDQHPGPGADHDLLLGTDVERLS